MRMIKGCILVVCVTQLCSCYGMIGTPGAIREHHRGINGGLSIAKMENDRTVDDYHSTQKATDRNALEALYATLGTEK